MNFNKHPFLITLLTGFLFFNVSSISAQSAIEQAVGRTFFVNVPPYMERTIGLNNAAKVEYKSDKKLAYFFVIEEDKEIVKLAGLKFDSVQAFYQHFLNDFTRDMIDLKLGQPTVFNQGKLKYLQSDLSYFETEAKVPVYYFVTIVESPGAYYKVLCYTTLENKDNLKADFENIGKSLRE